MVIDYKDIKVSDLQANASLAQKGEVSDLESEVSCSKASDANIAKYCQFRLVCKKPDCCLTDLHLHVSGKQSVSSG